MSELVAEVVKTEVSPVIRNGKNGWYRKNGTKKDSLSQTAPQDDPFEWGWRESTETLPDGRVIEKRIPLTLEDMLHPQEGDIHTQEREHGNFCTEIHSIFQSQLRDVHGDALNGVRVDWEHPHIKAHAPDLSVFFGIPKGGQVTTLYVKRAHAQPALCLEITSPSTRVNDVGKKVRHFEQIGVPFYIIIDRFPEKKTDYELLGYELKSASYQEMQPDARGYLWLEPVQLWLGLEDNLLVYLDKDNNPIGNFDQQRQRADAEYERANKAEKQADEAAAEIARLRALLAGSDAIGK